VPRAGKSSETQSAVRAWDFEGMEENGEWPQMGTGFLLVMMFSKMDYGDYTKTTELYT
jgi:hypothetical protein